MIDITVRLESATLDKDNFPRMDSERQVPVGLAKEAKAEIKRLREALMNNFACGRDDCWKEGWCLRAGVKCWEGDQPRWNAIEKAVAAERERCARIAERIGVEAMDAQWDQGVEDAKRLIAAAIRGSHHPG
jgi:hypothetical protein